MEWRYRLSAALNMTSILSFYPFNKWDKGLDSALSEQHSGVKESAFPKDSSLHLDAVGAPSPLWIAICLHLLWAEPCFHDDTRSRMITWLGLDPRPRSRISTPWKVSPFSLVIFGLHFANFWFAIKGSSEHIHKHTSHVNALPQLTHKPPAIRNLKCVWFLQTTWLCKIDDQHPKFCTLVGKMLYMSM